MLHPTILIIDDDPQIHRYLRPAMIEAGYRPYSASSGASGLEHVGAQRPDAVVLDLNIRDMRGEDLLAEVRRIFQGPVLILSARTRETEIIDALDFGADDFMAKPFGVGELLARIRVAFRRRIFASGLRPTFRAGGLSVDLVRRTVALDGALLTLSDQQYRVLARLAAAGGGAVRPEALAVGGVSDDPARTLKTVRLLVRQLRDKIERVPAKPAVIVTERSAGYRLSVDR